MLDDLRNTANSSYEAPVPAPEPRQAFRKRKNQLLGLSAVQRFFLAFILFLMVVVLGAVCLVFSGSIFLPF